MNYKKIIDTAKGAEPADLLLKNCQIINVFSGEIKSGNIAISDGRIAGIGDYEAREVMDMGGRFAAPGFIDGHVHIESAMVSPREFVRSVLPCGTTAVAADPHEIANVAGLEGIRYMLTGADSQPMSIFFCLPSCVPATHMETAGAVLDAEELLEFIDNPKFLALAEMMNYPALSLMSFQ